MFTPREQQQNPGCLDETLGRYTDQCHFVLSFYPRRQEFEPCMLLLWLRNHRVLSDRKKRCMHTYVTFEGIPDTRCPLPRELRRAPASKLSTHVICNPRDEAARLKKRNLLRHCAAPQQLCYVTTGVIQVSEWNPRLNHLTQLLLFNLFHDPPPGSR
jgi:hypothetical protein